MKIVLFYLFFLSFINGLSYPFVIDGMVFDKETNEPISNVYVSIENSESIYTSTDKSGKFFLNIINIKDNLNLNFSHISYQDISISIQDFIESNHDVYLQPIILYGDLVEVTSNLKETRISNSPQLTQIITGMEIKQIGTVDLYEALHNIIPDIMFTPDYHGVNLKIKGLDSEYVLILIDGDRIAGNSVGNIDFSKFNIDEIERIEVLNGGASTLYGSNAIGGVINIITKKGPKDRIAQINLSSKYASYETRANSGSFLLNSGKFSSKTDIVYKYSTGYRFLSDYELLLFKRRYKDWNINQKFAYNTQDISLEASFNSYQHDWYRYLTIFNQPEQNDRKQYQSSSAKLKTQFSVPFLKGYGKASYTDEEYIKYHVIDREYYLDSDDVLYPWTTHSVNQFYLILYSFFEDFSLTYGLDSQLEFGESLDVINGEGEILNTSELGNLNSKEFMTNALFIHSEFKINGVNVYLGTRFTSHDHFENRFTSQIGLKYNISNHHFRFNIGQGYRTPNIYELYYNWNHYDGFSILGNEELSPESSMNVCLSYQKLTDVYNFMVNIQRNLVNNMIAEERDNAGNFYFNNYGKASISSFTTSFSTSYKILDIDLNYSFNRIMDEIEYKRLPNNSEHMFGINLSASLHKYGLSVALRTNYYGEKTLITPTTDIESEIPSFFKSDLFITKTGIGNIESLKKIEFRIGINNLFDYTNFDDTTFQSPGRTFFANISFEYALF